MKFHLWPLFGLLPGLAPAAIPIDDLFSDPEYVSAKLSPDGRFIAVESQFDRFVAVEALLAGENQSQVLFKQQKSSTASIVSYHWIDRDSVLINYQTALGANMFRQIDLTVANGTLQTSHVEQRLPGKVHSPWVSKQDSFLMLYPSAADGNFNLLPVNLKTFDVNAPWNWQKLNPSKEGGRDFWLDSKGQVRLKYQLLEDQRHFQVWRGDQWHTFLELQAFDQVFIPVRWLNESTLSVLSNLSTDRVVLVKFDLETGTNTEVLFEHPEFDLEGATYWAESNELLSVSYVVNGKPRRRYFDSDDEVLNAFLKRTFKNTTPHVIGRTASAKRALILTADSDDSGKFFLLDKTRGVLELLAPAYPRHETYAFSKTEVFEIDNDKGRRVNALMTPPLTGDEPFPLLVIPHGGPIGTRETDLFDAGVQFYSSRGFGVLRMNFTGSFGFGKTFMNAGRGEFGKQIEDDIDQVVVEALSRYPIDPDKVCIVGGSYGGYSALMSVIRFPDRYQCAVSYFGVSDLELLFNQSTVRNTEATNAALRSIVGEDESNYRSVSPFYRANEVEVPTLFLSGRRDLIADLEQSNRMVAALEMMNKPVESVIYPLEGHGAGGTAVLMHQFTLIESFVRNVLGLSPPPFPVEYERAADFFSGPQATDHSQNVAARLRQQAAVP